MDVELSPDDMAEVPSCCLGHRLESSAGCQWAGMFKSVDVRWGTGGEGTNK